MDAVNEAMKALKQGTLKGKKDQGMAERVDSLTATLRLLDLSLSSDSQIFEKLVAAVRKPFIPLYDKFPTHAFQLSAAIFSFLFYEKIVMQLTAGNKSLQSSWEDVAESLLSGVLDFLETRSDGVTLQTLASVLYPVLCRICFLPAFCSTITMGSTLRYAAFTLLVDSANETTNREMLRDPEYLGSRRLGATLYGSKDYVILENFLLLVLIIAPKSEAMDKRSAFMREVFVTNCPGDTACGEGLAKLLAKPTEKDSDLIQAKAMDILAQNNLMFPQPFEVTQINSCGLTFPQKPPQQRLIVDYKSLLANVIKDEGYESLRVSFDQIRGISFSAVDQKPFTKVVVQISSAPQIQLRPLRVPDGQSPHVTFEIGENDVLRFKRTLRCRGVTVAPHISVSQEGPLLEFDREGNPIPEIITSVRKVQTIEQGMQLSQRSDDSPKDKDDQDRGYCLLVNKSPGSPLVCSTRVSNAIPQKATAATSSGSVSTPSRAPLDVTPPPRVSRQPSVFVPPTPSQNRILHKDIFGSSDTDLSDPSDDSEADSMKALSQKIAARSDPLVTITKHASVLTDTVFSVGPSGKRAVKRRVLDSEDEEVLSGSRKGAKDNSKSGVDKDQKAPPTVVVPDIGDDIPPTPATLKTRHKPSKKDPGPLVEEPEPHISDKDTPKRKREDKNYDVEAGGDSDVQENPPPVKRARKTAGRNPGTAKPNAVSLAPHPTPRDSQVLKKVRPAAKKRANYGRRTRAARISSPTCRSATLSAGDDLSDAPDLKIRTVDPRIEPPLGDAGDNNCASSPPAQPKPKRKSRAAAKPKPAMAEKSVAPERSKTTTAKAKAKTQVGTRTRVTVTKAKDIVDEEAVRVVRPQKAEKTKRKLEVLTTEEAEDMEEEEERGMVESARDSPAVIEVLSSPMEPPEVILPKRTLISQVTSQQEPAAGDATNTKKPTKDHPALTKKFVQPLSEGDSRVEAVAVVPIEVIAAPAPSPVRSTPAEKRAKVPAKPISGQVFATSVEQRQNDRTSGCTEIGRQPVTGLHAADESPLAQPNPFIVVSGGVGSGAVVGVVKEAVTAEVQGLQNADVETGRFDAIVAMSPVRIPTDGITNVSPVRVREPVELEELHQFEIKPDNGESPEGGTYGLTLPQPITGRMLVGISTPRERPWISAGVDGTAQSTPATLPRGPQQMGQMPYRKQRVTFAATPFKDEAVRSAQSAFTPRNGAQTRSVFEDEFFEMNGAWKRTPAKNSDKHSALIEVLDEIQSVIVKKVTHQFEVVEEEARFARNDVHNEALIDFKKMHSQRAAQFNALVDLETAYATRERELVVAYEALLAVNTEALDHIRQKIREHDEKNTAGKLPKAIGKRPLSALMNSFLK